MHACTHIITWRNISSSISGSFFSSILNKRVILLVKWRDTRSLSSSSSPPPPSPVKLHQINNNKITHNGGGAGRLYVNLLSIFNFIYGTKDCNKKLRKIFASHILSPSLPPSLSPSLSPSLPPSPSLPLTLPSSLSLPPSLPPSLPLSLPPSLFLSLPLPPPPSLSPSLLPLTVLFPCVVQVLLWCTVVKRSCSTCSQDYGDHRVAPTTSLKIERKHNKKGNEHLNNMYCIAKNFFWGIKIFQKFLVNSYTIKIIWKFCNKILFSLNM